MDALTYIQTDVVDQAVVFDVYRPTSDGAYDGDFESAGTASVAVFSPSSRHEVSVEGSDDPASYTGLMTVSRNADGDIEHVVQQDDQLRHNGHRYDVVVKEGVPNPINPELWRLGLDEASG
jgi:hypothetical protein